MVFYYEIAPGDRAYVGDKLLTYSYGSDITIGQVVVVKLRSKQITGFVVKKVSKPAFATKNIEYLHPGYVVPQESIKFFYKLNDYYPGSLGATAALFIPKAITTVQNRRNVKTNTVDMHTTPKPELSDEQLGAYQNITTSNALVHIIHGDTGTGKTRLYIELCINILTNGKSAIVLTPEISLTPQMYEQFYGIATNIYIIHSQLTVAEKRKIWLDISDKSKLEPVLVIGPRSALFSPLHNLGLIVVDEFHDTAYKQDQNPRFQTVRVASILSKITGSKLILGSATPPFEDYFYATKKGAGVHRLTKLPKNTPSSRTIKIVEISDESERSGYNLLTNTLLKSIQKTLDDHGQVMLFLNKRGSQRTLFCGTCGWISKCPRCNIPYIYHHDLFAVICHTCYKKESVPTICEDCGSADLQFKNPGTKQIESDINKLFPNAKIARYDKDNTKNESFATNQADIASGKIDILIGTQLLTKGHDLPKLKLVGVLNSDSGLHFPDYSSNERNFQTLWQVIGRVGRGHGDGMAIIQTYSKPEKIAGNFEYKNDTWKNFYDNELEQRIRYKYPPFVFMLKIELSRKTESILIKNIEELAKNIEQNFPKVEVIGPAPSIKQQRSGHWYWQLVIKSARRSDLVAIVKSLPKNCSYDLDPINLL